MSDGKANIQEIVQEGWSAHEKEPALVLQRVRAAAGDAREPGDVLSLGMLGVHVAGEHLGDWQAGRELAETLRKQVAPESEADKALLRMAATMALAAGEDWEPLFARGVSGNEASCRIRVFGLAAQALVARGEAARAARLIEECDALAAYGPGRDDPAARVLAMTGNNVACTLEEKDDRTEAEDALLQRTAAMARRWWEVAGDWRNVKIAEYRLAMTNLALDRREDAQRHAEEALRLCRENDGGPDDAFFCHEALARTAKARGDVEDARAAREQAAACLGDIEDAPTQAWCADALAKLDAHLEA